MSCPSSYPCEEVLARLWSFLDHELPPDDVEAVRSHLAACAHCFPQYDFQRAFLLFLRRHAEAPVPAELRRRVFEQLLAASAPAPDSGAGDPGGRPLTGTD